MGDIADMILNGDLCEVCGVYIEESIGLPQKCSSCDSHNKGIKQKYIK